MLRNQQSTARRILPITLDWIERLKGADVLLFFIGMLIKLYIFDRLIDVPNMAMGFYDVIVAIGTLALVSFWTIWLPMRGRIVALVILNLILSFIIYADLIYFRYFQDFISVPVLLQANQVDSLGESIGTLLHLKDFLLIIDWPFIIAFTVYMLMKRRSNHDNRVGYGAKQQLPLKRRMIRRFLISMIIFVIGGALSIGSIEVAKKTWALGLFEGNWWNVSLYNVTGVIGYHGYDVYRYADQHWLQADNVSAQEIQETQAWVQKRSETRSLLEQDSSFGAYKGSNVIMVQAEAFQNFMIGKSIGGEEITPNLNKLVEESVYFNQFYQQTAQGRTSDADFLSNCSLQPLQTGSVFVQYANNSFDCMPQILKDQGYQTSVFHAYEGGFWNRNTMYDNMSYDTFYSKKHYAIDEPIGWSLGDKSFFRQSVDIIAEQQKPFYSFLITLSSHHPYTIPEKERKLQLGELEGTMMGDYLQSIHYVDAALGELIKRLKTEGLWDNTIFAMYGDHDNSIKDYSMLEQFLDKPLSELERQMITKQVPFIVHLPNGAYAGTHNKVGGQLDVTPTLLHLLGIPTSELTLLGTPLISAELPENRKLVVQRNGAFTDGTVYYMPSGDSIAENGQCWNIADNAVGDIDACLGAVEDARAELTISDQIILHDLIPFFTNAAIVMNDEDSSAP
ncbi:MAG: LTA synthase family protein [Candidatus Pristimantibacillus sp.]